MFFGWKKKKLRWCILPTPLVYYNWQVKFPCHVCGKVGCEFLILFTNEIKFFTMQFKLVWINFVENLNYVYKWNAKFMQNYILKKGKIKFKIVTINLNSIKLLVWFVVLTFKIDFFNFVENKLFNFWCMNFKKMQMKCNFWFMKFQ